MVRSCGTDQNQTEWSEKSFVFCELQMENTVIQLTKADYVIKCVCYVIPPLKTKVAYLNWCQIEQKLKDSFTRETPFICFPFFMTAEKS